MRKLKIENNQHLNLFSMFKKPIEKTERKETEPTLVEDQYDLSVGGGDLNAWFAKVSQTMTPDEEKIAAFREKYEAGDYKIGGQEIVEKLMEGYDAK